MKKMIPALFLVMAMACEEDYYPPGLYASQIEWLLTGGTQKTWVLSHLQLNGNQISLDDCLDSIRVRFTAKKTGNTNNIANVEVYQYTYREDCQTFDTLFYGNMHASAAFTGNRNVFTDSLIFEGGGLNYLLVEDISSERVIWRQYQGDQVRRSQLQVQ